MPRTPLTAKQIGAFREELCVAAVRLFAKRGYDGVTLRGLADELGCSAMTPYRYFRDKAEIFAAVRAASFERFAAAQERAFRSTEAPLARLRAIADAYLTFAEREPDAYRIMFEMSREDDGGSAAVHAAAQRAWEPLRRTVELAVRAGELRGRAETLALLFWSGLHGVVSLGLAGSIEGEREVRRLAAAMSDLLTAGARSAPAAKRPQPTRRADPAARRRSR